MKKIKEPNWLINPTDVKLTSEQKIYRLNWLINHNPDMVEWEAGTKIDLKKKKKK